MGWNHFQAWIVSELNATANKIAANIKIRKIYFYLHLHKSVILLYFRNFCVLYMLLLSFVSGSHHSMVDKRDNILPPEPTAAFNRSQYWLPQKFQQIHSSATSDVNIGINQNHVWDDIMDQISANRNYGWQNSRSFNQGMQ